MELRQLGVQTTVLALGKSSSTPDPEVVRAPVLGPIGSGRALWTNPQAMLQFNFSLFAEFVRRWPGPAFDVVHAQSVYAAWCANAIRRITHLPIVMTEHGVPLKGTEAFEADYFNSVRSWIYPECARLIVLSGAVKSQVGSIAASAVERSAPS